MQMYIQLMSLVYLSLPNNARCRAALLFLFISSELLNSVFLEAELVGIFCRLGVEVETTTNSICSFDTESDEASVTVFFEAEA